jgi:hypothetical protein
VDAREQKEKIRTGEESQSHLDSPGFELGWWRIWQTPTGNLCGLAARFGEKRERRGEGSGLYWGGLRAGGGRASEARSTMDGLQRSHAGKGVQREEKDDMRARAVSG